MNLDKYKEIIVNNQLFKGLTLTYIETFLLSVDSKKNTYKKGEFIFQEGDKFDCLCILLEGNILLSQDDEYGNRNIIDKLSAGDMFAEVFSLTSEKISPVTATALSSTTILSIDTNTLLESKANDTSDEIKLKYFFTSRLLNIFANKNIYLISKIELISRRNIRDKILLFLENNKGLSNSNIFEIPFSRKEMADYLGVDRSALSRELGRLKDDGIIDFEKNTFKLL